MKMLNKEEKEFLVELLKMVSCVSESSSTCCVDSIGINHENKDSLMLSIINKLKDEKDIDNTSDMDNELHALLDAVGRIENALKEIGDR